MENNLLIPTKDEVIRSRDFGRIKGHLTRHQRVAFASFIKNSYLQMINSNNPDLRFFEIPLQQFKEELGINHRNIFSETEELETKEYSLENQLKQLMTKTLEWRYKDNTGKIVKVRHSVMLSDFEIDSSKQIVKYSLGGFLQDKVLCYGNAYITEMPIIASFRSGYSVALHDQLEQRKDFNKWKISVTELRELLGILPNEYDRVDNFKSRVLNPAITEIEKNTSYFNLKYTTEKKGRAIAYFIFTWGTDKKNKEHKGQLNFADIDSQIEELKTKIFEVNNHTLKLIDIIAGADSSEYIAKVENSKGERATIKLKTDLQESIHMLKEFII